MSHLSSNRHCKQVINNINYIHSAKIISVGMWVFLICIEWEVIESVFGGLLNLDPNLKITFYRCGVNADLSVKSLTSLPNISRVVMFSSLNQSLNF